MPLAVKALSTASWYLHPPISIAAVVATFILANDSHTSKFEPPTIIGASTILSSNIIYKQTQSVEMQILFDYTILLTLPKTNNKLMGRHWWWLQSKIWLRGWDWPLSFLFRIKSNLQEITNMMKFNFQHAKTAHNNNQLHCQPTQLPKQTETVLTPLLSVNLMLWMS